MPIKLNNTQPRYGALGQGFALTIDDGYQVLVGPNNSGKSSILQLAFNTVIQTHGSDHVALVLPERALVAPTTETGGRMLQNFNGELGGQIATTPMVYDGVRGPNALELPRLLITHTDYVQQLQRLDGYLDLWDYLMWQSKVPRWPISTMWPFNFTARGFVAYSVFWRR